MTEDELRAWAARNGYSLVPIDEYEALLAEHDRMCAQQAGYIVDRFEQLLAHTARGGCE